MTRPDNRQPGDAPILAQALERIEALERRLMMARAMAMDLRDWITRNHMIEEDDDDDNDRRG